MRNLLIIIGLPFLVIAVHGTWQRYNPARLTFASYTPPDAKHAVATVIPIKIGIPTVGIDVPVFPSEKVGTKWETTTNGASYVLSSPLPGEKGNSIFYGHNFRNIFGTLYKAKVGDKITVIFSDETKKSFRVTGTAVVTPDTVSILKGSEKRQITIYTCYGLLDEKRFVVTGELIEKELPVEEK